MTAGIDSVDSAYFCLTTRNGHIETRGQTSAKFGHCLPSTKHSVADGVFAQWNWNGTRFVVNNDRYGFYPLFWFRPPDGGVCVSPSLVTLVKQGAPTELDIEALAVFFRLGYFVGDDTPFTAVKTVPPNAMFEWEDGKLTCYGRYPQTPKASEISRDEAIDRYIDLFAQAIAKRAHSSDRVAVPLSGGRDSRHILLELQRAGVDPDVCISIRDFPPDPNQDLEVASMLCEKLGFKHRVVDQKLSPLSASRRWNRETHFCYLSSGWFFAQADVLSGQFACIYDGIAGDTLSQSSYLNPRLDAAFCSGDIASVRAELQPRHATTQSVLEKVLNGELRQTLNPQSGNSRLAREIVKHLDMPNPTASFIFWNRARRMIALTPYSVMKNIPRVYSPYLDHDLFDFLTTLPTHLLMDGSMHTDAIARAYPDVAHIPYADAKNAPRADDSKIKSRYLAELSRNFLLQRPSRLAKNIAPRTKMLVGAMSGGRISPYMSPLIVYLNQLEAIINGRNIG